MKAITGIFKLGEAMAVDAGLADAELRIVDHALNFVHAVHDGLAGTEQVHATAECGDATVMDTLSLLVRLTEAERALDMSEITADLRMDLAGDEVPRLHRPCCRKPERMRERITITGPEE